MTIKRICSILLAFVIVLSCVAPVFAAQDEISVYIDGVEQNLKNQCTIDDGGTVYVPMEEILFKLGIYMEWNEEKECYIGSGNNGEIRIKPGLNTIDINWVSIEMPGIVYEVNGVVMIPLYILEDAAKIAPPTYDEIKHRIDMDFPDISVVKDDEFNLERIVRGLPEGEELLGEGDFFNYSNVNANMDIRKIEVENMPFTEALEVETFGLPGGASPVTPYSIQANILVTGGTFEAYDVGVMTFWARTISATDESGYGRLMPVYEQRDKWEKAQDKQISIGYEWQKFYLPLYSGKNTLYAGNSTLNIAVGYRPQVIQIADPHIINYRKSIPVETLIPYDGSNGYEGDEEDALWRKEAERRVERNRKNDMLVRVSDKDGNPLEGAEVKVDMIENELRLGIENMEFEQANDNNKGSRVNDIREGYLKLFNSITCGDELKFPHTKDNGIAGRWMVNTALDRGMSARGHALAWDDRPVKPIASYLIGEIDSLPMEDWEIATYEELYEYYLKYAIAEIWMFKDICFEWDVLNEPHNPVEWSSKYGYTLFAEIANKVKALSPKSRTLVNEAGINGYLKCSDMEGEMTRADSTMGIINNIRNNYRGAIDGAGDESHLDVYNSPQSIYKEISTLADKFNYDCVSITEFDIWNSDEEYIAQYLYDVFLTAFSHPKLKAFTVWGAWDNLHFRRDSILFDANWNPKQEYYMWDYMVNEKFATHTSGITDKNGEYKVRAFRGKYEVTVKIDGVEKVIEFTLTDSDNTQRDNYIDVIVDGSNITAVTPNPFETFHKDNRVKFDNLDEAYADYLASGAEKWIGVYDHCNQDGEGQINTCDALQNTYYYYENGEYVQYELVENADWGNISIDFRTPLGEVYKYKILTSKDGEKWTEIYKGLSDENEVINFEDAMFIRIQSDGNKYMGISEVDIHAEKN